MEKIKDNNYVPILIISMGLMIAVFMMFLPTMLMAGTISLPKTGETTCYDTSGTLVDCAGTGQDGDIAAGVEWPDPRFTDHGDGTITDKLTGLMWTQDAKITCISIPIPSWQDALDYVAGMNSGANTNFDYTDWRLPNILEIFSLSHQGEHYTGTWLESQGFTNVGKFASTYWTSTTLASFTDRAWLYNLYSNFTWSGDKDENTFCFWPVRAGQQGTADPTFPANIRKTGQTTCYNSSGTEINCAGTGQDGEIQAGVSWPEPRFTDNGDGTVKDNLTGLDWMQDPSTISDMTWQESLDYIAALNDVGGNGNSRMSNVNELMSLMDFSQTGSMIPQSAVSAGLISSNRAASQPSPILASFWTSNTVSITNLNFEIYAAQVASYAGYYGNQTHADKGSTGSTWPIGPGGLQHDSSANFPYSGNSGEPVNTYTGELFSREPIDLFLGGPMPLYFQRYYASYLARSFIVGDLGDNWRHNFEWRIHWVGNQLTVVSDKGKILKYSSDGQGNWTLQSAPADIPYQVTQVGQEIYLGDPKNDRIYRFNAEGKLSELLDGKGNVFSLTYYADGADTGKLDTLTDGLGRALKFTYTTEGSLRKLSLVHAVYEGTALKSISFGYDSTGDALLSFTDSRGHFTEYQYADTSGSADKALMTRKILPEGNSPFIQTYYTTADQYVSGRVKTQADGYGNTITFTYPTGSPGGGESPNRANISVSPGDTAMTDTQSNTMTQTHNDSGGLTALTCSDGLNTNFGYDGSGRRNSVTDRLGNTSSMSYHEPTGKPSTITRADGTTSSFARTSRSHSSGINFYDLTTISYPNGTTQSFQYDSAGNITSHTDEDGNVTTYTYNTRGQVLTSTNPLSGVTIKTYNPDRTLATVTDPSNNTTSYAYDNQKRLVTITHPDGSTRTYTYDNKDNILTITDELNRTTTYTYNKNNNLISTTDPLNNTTTLVYNSMDSVVSVTDPLNNISTRTYDKYGRPKTQTDENGNTTTFNYDNRGRLISVSDPGGNTWPYTFNIESVTSSVASPLSDTTSFVSNAMRKIINATSPLSNVTNLAYDNMGRLASVQNPLGETTNYTYDNRGLLSSVTLPESITASYARNALGFITGVTDSNNKTWQKEFDDQGRLISTTDPIGNITSYQYNTLNQINQIVFPSGTLTISYDDAGNVTNRHYSDGTNLSYTYDGMNRLTSANGITLSYDGNGRVFENNGLTVTRDPGGRISTLTLAPGKIITYGYNSRNLVTSVTDWVGGTTALNYDVAGRVTTITRPNGVTTNFQFNNEDRISSIVEGNLASHVLTRNKNGQVVNAARQVPAEINLGISSSNYTYDPASQVSTFTYDNKGRLSNDGSRSYSWNLASRLTGYSENVKTVSFTYDAFGQRLSRTEENVVLSYIWNYAFELPSVSIEREDDIDTRYFVHTPDGMLLYSVNATSNERLFYHFDEIGNTMFLTSDSGAVDTSYLYGPYGENIGPENQANNPFTWQGRYGVMHEGSSGLYYIRNRYYDSQTGRFISRDKINNIMPRSISPYQYALSNPLMFTDSSGIDAQVHVQGVFGVAGLHSGISVDVWKDGEIVGVLRADYGNSTGSDGRINVEYHKKSTLEEGIQFNEGTETVRINGSQEADERLLEAMLKAIGMSREEFDRELVNKGGDKPGIIGKSRPSWKISEDWRVYNTITNCCNDFTDEMLDAYFGENWHWGDNITGSGLAHELRVYLNPLGLESIITKIVVGTNPLVWLLW